MSNGERVFVTAVKKYCASHRISVELKADGWLIAMTRGSTRRFAFGYDLGLNSAVALTNEMTKFAPGSSLRFFVSARSMA